MADRDDAWVREVVRLTRRIRSDAADAGGDHRGDGGDEDDGDDTAGPEKAPGDGADAAALRRERDRIAERNDHAARVRDDDVLVCYPRDWLDGGTVDPAAVEDTDRAVEVPLAGGEDDVATVREANDAVLDQVLEELDDAAGYNAAAFAEYLENHHRCRVAAASADQVAWFLEEYYPRNVWPPDGAEDRVEPALRALFAAVDRDDLLDWLDRRGDAGAAGNHAEDAEEGDDADGAAGGERDPG